MPTKAVFVYDYGDESNQFSFYRIPRQLIADDQFKKLSADARLLYDLLMDRMGLSTKNSWYDNWAAFSISHITIAHPARS